MTGPVHLGWADLALASTLLVVFGVISAGGRLGLGKMLGIAAVRSVVQLTLLGLVLVPVFSLEVAWPVLLWCGAMVVLAGREAAARTQRRHSGMLWSSIAAMALGGGGSALFATLFVLQVETWWAPRYLVPLVGMILGNTLSGVSLGLDRALASLEQDRDGVESLLALGATRTEATRHIARDAIRTGLIPILNTMSAVGLVSIPGMMTGQILGGTEPMQAARYQLLILFLIAGAVALSTTLSVVVALRVVVDEEHRLRPERIFK